MNTKIKSAVGQGSVRSVVLAGGWGGRLNAITDPERSQYPIAKAVVPIGARRSIDFSLDAARQLGLKETTVSVWHLADTIEKTLKALPDFKVSYYIERPKDPLDTAGAVAAVVKNNGWDAFKDDSIIVQSCDIIHNLPLDILVEQHLLNGGAGTIVVNSVPWDQVSRFGTVQLSGMPRRSQFNRIIEFENAINEWNIAHEGSCVRINSFREKRPRLDPVNNSSCYSNLNNSSIYIFNVMLIRTLMGMMTRKGKEYPLFPELYQPGGPRLFSDWGKQVFGWVTLPQNRKKFPLYAFVLPGQYYWNDIGLGETVIQANMDALEGKIDGGFSDYQKTDWGSLGRNVFIDPSATIERAFIGDNCIIGPRTKISRSIIGAGTKVEEDVRIYGSVIFPQPIGSSSYNLIGAGALMVDSLFSGGTILRGASYQRKMVYSPAGGCAIDSLTKKTDIF